VSPLAQAIVSLLEKLAEDELPVIANWIEQRLAAAIVPAAPTDPGTTQPAPAQPELPPRESPTKP
jgi:hypothetical protein